MKLIDKDALVAEIEKCVDRCNEKKRSCPVNTQVEAICDNKINAYNEIISHLNALDVKEVDLEKEIEEHAICMPMSEFTHDSEAEDFYEWAKEEFKYFFILGLKAQKGE